MPLVVIVPMGTMPLVSQGLENIYTYYRLHTYYRKRLDTLSNKKFCIAVFYQPAVCSLTREYA